MKIESEGFGSTDEGIPIERYTLSNDNGVQAQVLTWGGILSGLRVPDRNGEPGDVVLGFDDLESYLRPHPHFGATTGRYANRIANARFLLLDDEIRVTANEGQNHLHGGRVGFDKRVWSPEAVEDDGEVGVHLRYRSADGEEGFPGNLDVDVTYTLTDSNHLRIDYLATTDRPTVVNLTHHSYFNLADGGRSGVLDHVLQLFASHYTPADRENIPYGEIAPVEGTPLDFTQPQRIGDRLENLPEAYDQNFVLDGWDGSLRPAARVVEPVSGRVLEIQTTEPGLQFYTGNHLDGAHVGHGGAVYRAHHGLCLEAQHFPDSPNLPHFPSTMLEPGEHYTQTTVHRFSTE